MKIQDRFYVKTQNECHLTKIVDQLIKQGIRSQQCWNEQHATHDSVRVRTWCDHLVFRTFESWMALDKNLFIETDQIDTILTHLRSQLAIEN